MFHLFPSESMKKLCFVLLLVFPAVVSGDSGCEEGTSADRSRAETQKYKVGAIAAILAAGAIGVCLPFLGRSIPALRPENNIFFLIKAFAAGVILSTGFIHILPDAFESLTSPCLNPNPWENFPFTGFIAMMAAIGTLMIESFATGFYRPVHWENPNMNADQVSGAGHDNAGHVHVHTHGSHGHAHGSVDGGRSELMRHRVISQVLELGILVHSVIIGVSLGASDSVETIKPLIGALSFHQFFEGTGLGSCIAQAKFKSLSVAIMATFFSLTTRIGISSVYNEKSPTALIVQGVFDAAAAGILIYMALVDLLAANFMSPKLQSNKRIHLGANVCLLLGAGCMAVLAKWA